MSGNLLKRVLDRFARWQPAQTDGMMKGEREREREMKEKKKQGKDNEQEMSTRCVMQSGPQNRPASLNAVPISIARCRKINPP